MGCHAFPQGIFPIQDQTQVSHSADGFFIIKPPGKLKNTGVGSLSLLQGELPNPGMELVSSSLQADSLLADCVGDSQTRQQADNSYSVRTKSVPGNVLDAGKTIWEDTAFYTLLIGSFVSPDACSTLLHLLGIRSQWSPEQLQQFPFLHPPSVFPTPVYHIHETEIFTSFLGKR